MVTSRRTLEQLAQPVQRLGGRIDRYVGDGFLATFGIPEAHEDDPTRAVQTALEMQHAMHTLRREVQQSLYQADRGPVRVLRSASRHPAARPLLTRRRRCPP